MGVRHAIDEKKNSAILVYNENLASPIPKGFGIDLLLEYDDSNRKTGNKFKDKFEKVIKKVLEGASQPDDPIQKYRNQLALRELEKKQARLEAKESELKKKEAAIIEKEKQIQKEEERVKERITFKPVYKS
jgi:hypothetical protein